MPRLVIAAGGTGGHMFPAQALAEVLGQSGWKIALMTDARGQKHAGKIGADKLIEVQAASISPKKPVKAISGVMRLAKGVHQAKKFMSGWQADAVIGFGGYPAFPAMRAGQSLGLPTLIHEQNAVLGRVNRLFAARASKVASGFKRLDRLPAGAVHVVTGNPLRRQIIEAIPEGYDSPDDTINVLIIGGSLGARLISRGVPKAIATLPAQLRSRLNVIQQTRAENMDEAKSIYESAGVPALLAPFFSDIEKHLAAAHYIIGRAGASSVSEIAAMGKPSLLVPLAIAMDDHQSQNASVLESLNAADILPESRFTNAHIVKILEQRLNDTNWLENAARAAKTAAYPDAANRLAELVTGAVQDVPEA